MAPSSALRHTAITALAAVWLGACGSDRATPAPPSMSAASASADPALPADGYAAAGLPPIDRAWTAREYAAAKTTLEKIAADDPRRLPRAKSARSAAAFERIVSVDNFATLRDAARPPAERMLELQDLVRAFVAVQKIYLDAGKDDDARWALYRRERLAFMVTSQRTSLITWELVDALTQKVAPAEAAAQAQKREALAAQSAKQIGLTLARFEDGEPAYEDLAWFAKALRTDLPALLAHVGGGAREDARRRIEKAASAAPDATYKASLEDLARSLAAS